MDQENYQEYMTRGETLLSAGKMEKALEYFQKAEKEDPHHVELYINMGMIYANQDQLDTAEKIFKKALLVDKKCGEAYFHLGCVAGLKGDLIQGIRYLDTAQADGYENSQLYFTLGLMYEEQVNTSMALRNYNKALGLDPARADVHLQKGNLLIREERREEAVEAFGVMVQNCPDYFEGYHFQCRLLSELGRFGDAEDVLKKGMELFPEETGFQVDQARILIVEEKLEEAAALLKKLEEKNDEEWKREILLEEVRIAGIQDNYDGASGLLERAYRECRVDDQPDEEVCYLLMSVYMTGKQYEKALSIAKELMGLSGNSTYINIAQFYYGEALKNLGKTEEAKAAFETTVKRCRAAVLEDPSAMEANMIRALALNRLGENEKALELVDYVLEFAPDAPELHSVKAVILKDMGHLDELEEEKKRVNEAGGYMSDIMAVL
jgi:tetratricopeptide (TPR) repeat protein